jgi:hypothetical protein
MVSFPYDVIDFMTPSNNIQSKNVEMYDIITPVVFLLIIIIVCYNHFSLTHTSTLLLYRASQKSREEKIQVLS